MRFSLLWINGLKISKNKGVQLVEIDYETIITLNNEISFVIALYEARVCFSQYAENAGINLETLVEKISSPDVKGILQGDVERADS